jgi:Protein of unknown function (DUF2806)
MDDLTGIGKLGEALVVAVSNAIGVIYKPTEIKRIGKAKADADAYALLRQDSAKFEIEERAKARELHASIREQQNTEIILSLALDKLPLIGYNNTVVNEDWLIYFFDHAKKQSNTDIQNIWATLLSAETKKPGSISKRTLAALTTMERRDADKFTELSAFRWTIDNSALVIIPQALIDHKISYECLKHLDDTGAATFFKTLADFKIKTQSSLILEYDTKRILLKPSQKSEILTGSVQLSTIGNELLPLVPKSANDEIFDLTIEYWKQTGHSVEILSTDTSKSAYQNF